MIGQTETTPERQLGSAEWHARVALKTIECLAATDSAVDAIHRILRVIVDETGIRCVGIRLQEGDDFPFYAFNGFPREFIRLESSLCLRSPEGGLVADAKGRPALDCLCGRILRGQASSGEDCFTGGGSFFTACLQTLATTVDPAKLGLIRGRCIAQGFETHALVPLRQGVEIIGLLHLSDPSPHMLTGEDIAFLERLGASVGLALAHKRAVPLQRITDDTYRELFDRLGWGYALHEMIVDEKGIATDYVTLDINQAFERLLGESRETVVGKRASVTLPAAELARWLATFGDVAAGGPPTTYETYSPHNQKHFHGHVYSLRRGFFSVAFEDATERNKARVLLMESEERYRTLIEMAEDVILLTDLDGGYLFRNSAYYTSLGFAVGEPVVPSSIERIHPDDAQMIRKIRATQLEHGSVAAEFRVQHRDGHWIWRSGRSTLVRDEFGKPKAILAVLRDVTEHKQAEAERHRLQSQLFQAQKMEALGTLAGGIAHDFNNILAAILGGVELAMMKTDGLGGDQGEGIRLELNDVRRAAQRASALVRQVLSFSRRNPEDKKPLLLRPLVKEACKFLRSALPSTIEIHAALSIDGPVLANPTQIHQVFMNLLTNAGLAMPEGGRIDIELDEVDLDQGFVAAHPRLAAGRFVRLAVRDTGCGIAPENLGRIFEPLFTTRSERRGTGLGLAIVHGIVAEHGGVVTVSSEVGKGALFQVFLPWHNDPIAAAELEEKAQPGTERVLFVDDEETLVQMAERGLGVLGYRVKGFVSSVEALRAFRAAPDAFDIVVSDVTMPGLTGEVLATQLRRVRPDIPIVILTGTSERMAQERARAAGIDGFLLKPVTVAGLTVCLRKILDSKTPPRGRGDRHRR